MKYFIILGLIFINFISCKQTDFEDLTYEDLHYQLVFSDEFNSSEIDTTKWNFEIGDGCQYGLNGWGNNELQYYKRENTSIVENKYLKIESKKEVIPFSAENCDGNNQYYEYTSSRINTKNKFDFKYGRVEASIKMDMDFGVWHAFWMLPSYPLVNWPLSGEIDIMEQYQNTNSSNLISTVHYDYGVNDSSVYESVNPDFSNNFHTYVLEWDKDKIVWFIDDELVHEFSKAQNFDSDWPFDDLFHIILNTAVGGSLGGSNTFDGNQQMLIDYVRVYQKTIL